MNAQVTIEIHPFVAIIHGELKTTSLKIAEHFGKQHKNVMQAIQNIDCPQEFSQLNFQPAEYTDEQGKKRPCYELTRDGFTYLAMAFTGKKAALWKVAYINAFNAMEKELLGIKSLKNSFSFIEPPTITNAQAGEIFSLVADKTRASGKHSTYFMTRFKNHFKLSTYKHLPADRFDEARDFLRRLEGDAMDSFVMLSHKELNALTIANDIKALNRSEALPQEAGINSITLTLAPSDKVNRWLVMQVKNEFVSLQPLSDEQEVLTKETVINQLIDEGYLVIKKADVMSKLGLGD